MTKEFLILSSLNILANISVPLTGMVDISMLGKYYSIVHLGGVAIASVIFDFIYWGFGFLRMGTTGPVASAFAQKNNLEVSRIISRSFIIAIFAGSFFILLQYFIAQIGFLLMNASEEVTQKSRIYFNIRIWAAPFVLINFVLVGTFLGLAKSKAVLFLTLFQSSINILGNYLFIIFWHHGVGGAATSTLISQALTCLVGFTYLVKISQHFKINLSVPLKWSEWKKSMTLNKNIFIRTLMLIFTLSYFTRIAASFGDRTTLLATDVILRDIMILSAFITDGFAFAVESLIGKLWGKRKIKEIIQLLKLAVLYGVLTTVLFLALILLFQQSIFKLFTHNETVLNNLSIYVWWLVPTLLAGAFAFVWDGYFLGIAEAKVLKNSMYYSAFLIFFPLAYLSFVKDSNHILWFSLFSLMLSRAIILFFEVKHSLKHTFV